MKIYTALSLFLFNCLLMSVFAQNKPFTLSDTTTAIRLLNESTDLNAKSKFTEGYEKAENAQMIFEQLLGRETIQVAAALAQRGIANRGLNKFDDAILYHEQCLTIRKKILGKVHLSVAQSNNFLGTLYRFKGNYPKSLENLLECSRIREGIYGKGDVNMLRTYNNLGDVYLSMDDFEHALEYDFKALNILLKFHPENIDYISKQYNNIALVYTTLGQYNRAKDYFQRVLAVQRKIFSSDNIDIAMTYTNIGALYNHLGDYDKAIVYLYKSLNILLKHPAEVKNDLEMSFRSLGISCLFKGDYHKAINHFREAISILEKTKDVTHPAIFDLYSNIGISFLKNEQTDSAIYYLQFALDRGLKTVPTESLNLSQFYMNLGFCYDKKKEYLKALEFFQKSLKLSEKLFGVAQPALIFNFQAIGATYFHKKDYKKAIEYLEKALIAGRYSKKTDISLIDNKRDITQVLKTYGLIYLELYEKTHEAKYLEQSIDYSEQAINGINNQEEGLNTEGAKSVLKNTTYDIYETAIRGNYLLSKHKNKDSLMQIAFQYAEQSKAKLLQSQIQSAHALSYAGLSDSLLQLETSLRESIAYYEKQRQEKFNQGKLETDSSILSISNTLFEIQKQYDSLKNEMLSNNSDYYRLKYNLKTLNVPDVQQKLLSPDHTLLEYFVGDSSIFIFTINKKDFDIIELKNNFGLDSLIRLMRDGMTGYHLAEFKTDALRNTSPIAYTEGATKLYQKLVAPVKKQLKKHVIVVPDGILNYIPFEALLIKKDNKAFHFNSHTYLLDEHCISYTYSATLLSEMLDSIHKTEPRKTFLGMAPYFTGDTTLLTDIYHYDEDMRKSLQPIPAAGQEIANIAKLMKGDGFYGNDATEDKFSKIASQYRIIHLSTHGKANDKIGDYSYLAFTEIKDSMENELLYVRELYNLSFNADMVVLSACETGIGQLQRGEGVVSLARAFSYAGAKSIITTLWEVTDEKSKLLMIDFYKNLVRGRSKDESLWYAKRRFMKKVSSDPFYWSGFIGIGDMRPLKN